MSFYCILLRHPPLNISKNICYGRKDVALREGWEQKLLPFIAELRKKHIHIIYTSPLHRCLDPARWSAHIVGAQIDIDERLVELNFGDWEGKDWDSIGKTLLDRWARDVWHYQIPGGESVAMLRERVESFWEDVKKRDEDIAIVTHGGVLRILCSLAMGRAPDILAKAQARGDYRMFHVEN